MVDEPYRWVAMALRIPPAVAILTTHGWEEPEAIRIGETAYLRTSACDLSVFYDWLRTEPGRIVGVRFLLEDECSPVLKVLRRLPFVRITQAEWPELYFYFSDTREYEPDLSDDQDFAGNAVLISASGEYALLFGSGFPSLQELESIRTLDTYVEGAFG